MREEKKKDQGKLDCWLLFLVLFFVVFGLVLLYSTSAYNGRVKFHDPAYYFKKQLFAAALGGGVLYLVSRMDYHRIARFSPGFYLLSLLLSLAVLFAVSYTHLTLPTTPYV